MTKEDALFAFLTAITTMLFVISSKLTDIKILLKQLKEEKKWPR